MSGFPTAPGVAGYNRSYSISLQASKFTKNELLTHIFLGFYLDFNLLFIVFFLRNHFSEGCFTFQWGRFVFQMGSFIYKWGWGGVPHIGGGIGFGEELKKNFR